MKHKNSEKKCLVLLPVLIIFLLPPPGATMTQHQQATQQLRSIMFMHPNNKKAPADFKLTGTNFYNQCKLFYLGDPRLKASPIRRFASAKELNQIGWYKKAQRAKAKNVKRVKTAVTGFSTLAALDAQTEWERFERNQCWYMACRLCQSLSIVQESVGSLEAVETGDHHQTSKN